MSLLPDPRRIVTGHDESGRSIVVADSIVPCIPTAIKCNFAVLYETHQFPASNDEWVDPIQDKTKSLANDKGVVLRVVDFPPHTETVSNCIEKVMSSGLLFYYQIYHRTESLDFGILHEGEITWSVHSCMICLNYN
jgi:hypothetical protein